MHIGCNPGEGMRRFPQNYDKRSIMRKIPNSSIIFVFYNFIGFLLTNIFGNCPDGILFKPTRPMYSFMILGCYSGQNLEFTLAW